MPTETKPRLIDANALIEELRSYWYEETSNAVFSVKSAPTVETTDDVLARLPDWTALQKSYKVVDWLDYLASSEMERWLWETPLEAIKKLEESLNRK